MDVDPIRERDYLRIKWFLLFVISALLVVYALNYEKETKIEEYLQTKGEQAHFNYMALYNQYKKIALIILRTQINQDEVIEIFKDAHTSDEATKAKIRQRLYHKLSLTYALLKANNLKQLHFHLPDNESFLRFHRPAKFGDNLTGIRATVEYVNRYKKPIDGFEEGRIYNGYRFVYPLFDKNSTHIGSVEVSFSSLAFHTEYFNDYHLASNFLISKKAVDAKVFESERSNYIDSPLKNFYFEKKIYKKIQKYFEHESHKVDPRRIEALEKELLKGEVYSLYNLKHNTIRTFIPVVNPITHQISAFYVSLDNALYIIEKINNTHLLMLSLVLLLMLIFYFIYKNAINQRELISLNKSLHQEVEDKVNELRKQEEMILLQNRFSEMGQMISMIAHQWRQPLNALAVLNQTIILKYTRGKLDEKIMEYFEKSSQKQIDQMSQSINDFRDFFKPDKGEEKFLLNTLINHTIELVKPLLNQEKILIAFDATEEYSMVGYPNEFGQALLNILNNAKDALSTKAIEHAKIQIELKSEEDRVIITIGDNAGGIPNDSIDKIFEPYFSTKSEKNGTGLGLYMSKLIIQKHMGGAISVSNGSEGALFKIVLPLN